MLVQTIVYKISESIDDLGRLLDQLYRFASKQREKYYQQIHLFKNRLITLKTNVKEPNIVKTEKLYKEIFLSISNLKHQINEQACLAQNKQNRDMNRYHLKDRKDHDQAMRLIVEKDCEIQNLRCELDEKERLIIINYEELRQYKKECALLADQNKNIKLLLNELELENSTNRSVLIKTEEQVLDFQLKDQQRQRCSREALQQLNVLKTELISAHQKLQHYQQFAQQSIQKNRFVQQNIRKIQMEAEMLNINYRNKEDQNYRISKEIQALQVEIREKNQNIEQLESQIQSSKSNFHNIETEMTRLQKRLFDQRAYQNQQKDKINQQIGKYQEELDKCKRQHQSELKIRKDDIERLTKRLQQSEQTNKDIQSKYLKNERQNHKLVRQLNEANQKIENLIMDIMKVEQKLEICEKSENILKNEKQRTAIQLEKSIILCKQLEIDILNLKEKIKIKDQEKASILVTMEIEHMKIKNLQRDNFLAERSVQTLQKEYFQLQASIIKLEQNTRGKQKQIESLKKRLIKAKIEAIHQIRQSII